MELVIEGEATPYVGLWAEVDGLPERFGLGVLAQDPKVLTGYVHVVFAAPRPCVLFHTPSHGPYLEINITEGWWE